MKFMLKTWEKCPLTYDQEPLNEYDFEDFDSAYYWFLNGKEEFQAKYITMHDAERMIRYNGKLGIIIMPNADEPHLWET